MCRLIFVMFTNLLLLISLFGSQGAVLHQRQFYTLHQWSHSINMTFPSAFDRHYAVDNGYYNVNRIQLPVDIDVEYRDNNKPRIFLTLPRFNFGIPYSLATIIPEDYNVITNPRVQSYPNYEWHKGHGLNCTSITSALRTYIDECNRLWVMDSGQINSLQWCAPQLLVFELKTDELIHRYKMPNNNYKAGISVYTDMVVDVRSPEECKDTTVYVADAWGHGLIVYNMLKQKSWRIEHDVMKPDKTITNTSHDGIFTVSLSPKNNDMSDRYLYFHSLNSFYEIRISLKYVNNESLWYYPRGYTVIDSYFTKLGSRGLQCESEAMDSYGNLYCSILGSNALVRWKEGRNYSADDLNVVAYGPQQWRFVTGLKLTVNLQKEQELWALSTEPKLFISNAVQQDIIKYQIIGCRVRNLLRSDDCTVDIRHIN